MDDKQNKNRNFAISLAMLVCGMIMLAYASVPLYDLFCRVTGFNGTTMRAESSPNQVFDREIIVRLNTETDKNLAWDFKPEQNEVRLKVGENKLAFFSAQNISDANLTGTAVYNVTPEKAGKYFNKIQCFCFENQLLKAGEKMEFPVSFFIDPEILNDRNLDDVKTITLSYTFFKVQNQDKNIKTSEVKNGKETNL